MATGGVDFAVSVRRWVEQAKGRAQDAFQATAMDAAGRVKELTPVKTGYLRANWVDLTSLSALPKPSMAATIGGSIRNAKLGDTIYVVNPVAYARRIEYGFVGEDSLGRRFNQHGRGMVAQTVTELPAIAQRAAARYAEGSK